MEQVANVLSSVPPLLVGDIGSADVHLSVSTVVGFPISGNFRIRIDNEILKVTNVAGSDFTVLRGQEGTVAVIHVSGAPVRHILTGGGLAQIIDDRSQALIDTAATGQLVPANGSYTLVSTPVLRARVVADGNPRFEIDADGKHQWGAGNGALDTLLYRRAAFQLKTDNTFQAGEEVYARHGQSNIVSIGSWGPSNEAGIAFGSGLTDRIYRSAAGTLKTDGSLQIAGASVGFLHSAAQIAVEGLASTSNVFLSIKQSSDSTGRRMAMLGDGTIQWGAGGASNIDTNLYRGGASILQTDSTLVLNGSGLLNSGSILDSVRTGATQSFMRVKLAADSGYRLNMYADGKFWWSDGTAAGTGDTNLYRAAANTLQTDGALTVGGGGGYGGALTITRGVTSNPSVNIHVTGEAVNRLVIRSDGQMLWSDGTASGDTNLYRLSAAVLKTDGGLTVGADLTVVNRLKATNYYATATGIAIFENLAGNQLIRLGLAGPSGEVGFALSPITGGASDSNLYRSGIGTMKTDGALIVVNFISSNNNITALDATTKARLGQAGPSSEPGILLGSLADTNLYRSAAGILKTDTKLQTTNLGVGTTPVIQTLIRANGSTSSTPIQRGLEISNVTVDSAATTQIDGIVVGVTTPNTVFTTPLATGITLSGISKGAAHIITEARAVNIASMTGQGSTTHAVYINGTGNGNDINWSGDTNLYRASAGLLQTDSAFILTTTKSVDQAYGLSVIITHNTAVAGTVYGHQVSASATHSVGLIPSVQAGFYQAQYKGVMGAQATVAVTNLQGFFTRTVVTGASPVGTVSNGIAAFIDSVANFATGAPAVTITNQRGIQIKNQGLGHGVNGLTITNSFALFVDAQTGAGTASWGLYFNGTSGTVSDGISWNGDTNLYRSAAARLKTDHLFDTTTLGVATKQKAGTPVDGDWTATPPDGTIVGDSTGSKIWIRLGGTWKSVAVA